MICIYTLLYLHVLPFCSTVCFFFLRRIFTALLFHFQCFEPLLLCFIVCWRLFSSRAFLFLQLLFHFDYLRFFVHLHRSDQSNPPGNVTICSFRFIHSFSKMFIFLRMLDPSWVFCLMLQWNCFGSSCGYPWNGLTESADQTSFHSLSWGCTAHLQWDLFCGCILLSSGLFSKSPQYMLMKNNLRGAFSMKLPQLSDSRGQNVTWSGCCTHLHEPWLELETHHFMTDWETSNQCHVSWVWNGWA